MATRATWLAVCCLFVCVSAVPQLFCPAMSDLTMAYGNAVSVRIYDQGWKVLGGGATATKAAFNLLGGFVEFDVDFSSTHPGVNANIYTISPQLAGSSGFVQSDYCDGARPAGPLYCTEADWIERYSAKKVVSNSSCVSLCFFRFLE
jgi:hypothetical protein